MDLSSMSTDELMAMYQKLNGSKAGPAASGQRPKLSTQDAKALQASRDEAEKSVNTATQAERFLDINKNVGTGGLSGAPGMIGGAVRAIRGAVDPKFAQMDSITSSVAPGLRPPGSGSSSDKDVGFYTRGFTNTQVPYEANNATYGRLHAQSDRAAAHSAFLDTWAQKRGTLMGSEPAFLQYWAAKKGQGLKQRSDQAGKPTPDGATVDIFGRPVDQ